MSEQKKVVTRFAPSPTGFLHVGAMRTALFAYLVAKKYNGTFLLRIEDTDKKREVAGAVEQIKESLHFLGVTWDFGPDKPSPVFGSLIQSERLPVYHEYAKKLLASGHAYIDTTSEEELEHLRKKAEEEKRPFLYREVRPESLDLDWSIGKVLRFKTKKVERTVWHDAVRGELSAGEEALDDFVLLKEDGFPTYNFCHIVDDIEMGVTHVLRSQEFIASTPKFLALYEALGITPPIFATVPPVLGETGNKKLSKRDGAKSALDYKDEGYLGDALFNFLAFLGFNPGGEQEIYSKEALAEIFELSKIQKGGARFNPEKLDWYNKEYIKQVRKEDATEKMLSYFTESELKDGRVRSRFEKMASTALERSITFKNYYEETLRGEYDYLRFEPTLTNVSLVWKKSTIDKTNEVLGELYKLLDKATDEEQAEKEIRKLAAEKGNGDVLWPLRVALSGKEKSPDPFTLLRVLGLETSKQRVLFAQESLH